MAKKNKPTRAPSNELWPIVIGTGAKLRYKDGSIRVSVGSTGQEYPVGPGENEAAGLVTYTSYITFESDDALTMEGQTAIGWLLVDGNGQVLGRLANDEDVVYDTKEAKAFAKKAGLVFQDWGMVQDKRIDKLMRTPRTDRKNAKFGATGREWTFALAVAGGVMFTWPFLSQVIFTTKQGEFLVIAGVGIGGFFVAAFMMFLARILNWVPKIVFYLAAAAMAVYSAYASMHGYHVWKLSPQQWGASLLGVAVMIAAMPKWAEFNKEVVHTKPADLADPLQLAAEDVLPELDEAEDTEQVEAEDAAAEENSAAKESATEASEKSAAEAKKTSKAKK